MSCHACRCERKSRTQQAGSGRPRGPPPPTCKSINSDTKINKHTNIKTPRALMKPMSAALSRKHWRHMLSSYLRIRPCPLPVCWGDCQPRQIDRREPSAIHPFVDHHQANRHVWTRPSHRSADPTTTHHTAHPHPPVVIIQTQTQPHNSPHTRQPRPPLPYFLGCAFWRFLCPMVATAEWGRRLGGKGGGRVSVCELLGASLCVSAAENAIMMRCWALHQQPPSVSMRPHEREVPDRIGRGG